MVPVEQTTFGKWEGNCFQAAVASVLELPLRVVPHFCQNGNPAWWHEFQVWLKQRALWPLCFQDSPDTRAWLREREEYYIAGGLSPRDEAIHHAVVGHKGELVHNPHSGGGPMLAGEPEEYMVILPLEEGLELQDWAMVARGPLDASC